MDLNPHIGSSPTRLLSRQLAYHSPNSPWRIEHDSNVHSALITRLGALALRWLTIRPSIHKKATRS